MLFDLRSKSRRRAVQVIYLGLAIIMGGGLILFGVGTGNGNGGLLNGIGNTGSGNGAQNSAVSAQLKSAEKAVKAQPNSASSWAALVQAYWSAAGTDQNSTTGTYDATGKKFLRQATTAYEHYTTLTKSPAVSTDILASRAYAALSLWAGQAQAWQNVTLAMPTSFKGYECWAAAAYAAKQTRTAGLAADKALSLTPKLQQSNMKTILNAAKTSTAVASEC